MLRYIVVFVILCFSLLAQEDNQTSPPPISHAKPKTVYLSVLEQPKTVYTHSVIGIQYKLLILSPEHRRIDTQFYGHSELEILNPDSEWENSGDATYTNTFYYKFLEANATLPTLQTTVHLDLNTKESETLSPQSFDHITLNGSETFCGVIAQEMTILNQRTTTYDKEHNLLVFEASTISGNLEDFHYPGIERQGIESLTRETPKTHMIYYAIIPNNEDFFRFEYFNLKTRSFQSIKIPNLAKDERVSTQSDIRPKKTIQFSMIAIMAVIIVITLILFFIKRKLIYLLMLIASSAYLVLVILPQKEVLLRKDAPIYILPSPYSTNYLHSPIAQKVTVLNTKEKYLKIQLPDGQIGWVKKQDVR